jgi:excisionase family DNA binding protein
MDHRYYTIGEVAQIFQISRSHAYRLQKEQKWPGMRFGTELRYTDSDIQAIAELNRKPEPTPPTKRTPRIGTRANRNKP